MEFLEALPLINKISLFIFIIISFVLGYEIISLKKEGRKKTLPNIPKFDASQFATPLQMSKMIGVKELQPAAMKKQANYVLYAVVVLFIIFGTLTIIGFVNRPTSKTTQTVQPTPAVSYLTSKGIRLYDSTWKEIENAVSLQQGDKVYIGIETVKQVDIDMARIRINEQQWREEQTTTLFNQEHNVFYREYTIASGESRLNIQAQLHSKSDGWITD